MAETSPCLVVYDIPNDRARTKVGEACLDAGLVRFQYSCFFGKISPGERRALFKKLVTLLDKGEGSILIQPLSAEDVARRQFHGPEPREGTASRLMRDPATPEPTILRFE